MQDLSGRTAVITGGATGIGAALAHTLGAEGMKVVIASRTKGRLDAAVAELRYAGVDAASMPCDVASRAEVEVLLRFAVERFGSADVLCANAGVTTTGPFLDHRPLDWDWVYDVVFKGVANCVQVFYPHMVEQGSGHIMLTGSQAGLVPNWIYEHGPYTSAKAAVMALGAALRIEAEEHGVEISVLIPSGVATDLMATDQTRPAKYGDPLVASRRPRSGRRIEPEEAARRAVEGIRMNAPWTATHPELRDFTKAYFDSVLTGYRD